MKHQRDQAHKILEALVCKGLGHDWAQTTSKMWGINYCTRCKKPRFYPTESDGPK
jgi:hypothetical protein